LKINIDVVDLDNTEISKQMLTAIEKDDMLVPSIVSNDEAYQHVKAGKRSAALIIPSGFEKKVKSGEDVELKIIYDPSNQLESGVLQGKLQGVIFSSDISEYAVPSMIEKILRSQDESEINIQIAKQFVSKYVTPKMKTSNTENKDESSGGSMFGSSFDDLPIKVVSEKVVGEDISSSAGYVQAIVSAMVMFLLFGVSFGASVLLKEKKNGTLKRLMTSPLTVEGILSAKLISLMTTGMMQVYFMLIVGWIVFHLDIWDYPVQLFLMALATTLMASGLGVLLTGLARTEEQAGMLATLVILSLSAIGGAMIPRFIMPEFLKTVGYISPVSWAMDGFHNVFWYHQGFAGMIVQFAVLIGFAVLFLLVGSFLVKRQIKNM
jgi:ABC-2 type transport system permease protein